MLDSFGRNLNYLRVSVTDRCNLRCSYCMPEKGIQLMPHEEILSFDEILKIIMVMSNLGVDRVRLTGGEPLVRKGIILLANEIKKIKGINFLGLTTNGVLLENMADDLKNAGIDGLNISLDTTDALRYEKITHKDELKSVLRGINKAIELNFNAIKINCVLSPESTLDDWIGVVSLAEKLPVDVRLIEWMPIADDARKSIFNSEMAFSHIEEVFGRPQPLNKTTGQGPARYWKIPGFTGNLGIIDAMSHNFCNMCNRLRLTASGNLKLCLFYDVGISLKKLLRSGASNNEIARELLIAVKNKPKQHQGIRKHSEDGTESPTIERNHGMYDLGG